MTKSLAEQQRSIKRPRTADKDISRLTNNSNQKKLTDTVSVENKILSSLSPEEADRYEAFNRCSIQRNVISKILLASLLKHSGQGRELLEGENYQRLLLAKTNEDDVSKVLSESVESSSEILVTVASLAKVYAQRLASAALRVAEREQHQEEASSSEQQNKSETNTEIQSSAGNNLQPKTVTLEPRHILEAYNLRREAGLDPGFFMGHDDDNTAATFEKSIYSTNINISTATGELDRDRLKLEAARTAQEDYYSSNMTDD